MKSGSSGSGSESNNSKHTASNYPTIQYVIIGKTFSLRTGFKSGRTGGPVRIRRKNAKRYAAAEAHLAEDDEVEKNGAERAEEPGSGGDEVCPAVRAQQDAEAVQHVGGDGAHEHGEREALRGLARPVLVDLGQARAQVEERAHPPDQLPYAPAEPGVHHCCWLFSFYPRGLLPFPFKGATRALLA